jgi:uncharacterized protein YndB with AHSA1/START domain
MPLCEIDLRVGGAYRYVWRSEQDGSQMALSGVFREITPVERLVATEKFDDAWHPGEALDTTVFVETGAIARTTITDFADGARSQWKRRRGLRFSPSSLRGGGCIRDCRKCRYGRRP